MQEFITNQIDIELEEKNINRKKQLKKELEYKKNIYNYGYQFAEKFRVGP